MALDLVTRLRKIADHELDHPAAEAADEIERLTAALEKAADTFADLRKGFTMMQKPLLVASCQIAEEASREALREPKS